MEAHIHTIGAFRFTDNFEGQLYGRLDHHHWMIIHAVAISVISVSLLGSFYIIYAAIWLRCKSGRPLRTTQKFPMWISICDILFAIFHGTDHIISASTGLVATGGLCRFLGFMTVYSMNLPTFWVTGVAWYLWRMIVFNQRPNVGKQNWKIHVIFWGVPLIWGIIPFITYDYGQEPAWCGLPRPGRLLIFNGWLVMVAMIFNSFFYGHLTYHLWSHRETARFLTQRQRSLLPRHSAPQRSLDGMRDGVMERQPNVQGGTTPNGSLDEWPPLPTPPKTPDRLDMPSGSLPRSTPAAQRPLPTSPPRLTSSDLYSWNWTMPQTNQVERRPSGATSTTTNEFEMRTNVQGETPPTTTQGRHPSPSTTQRPNVCERRQYGSSPTAIQANRGSSPASTSPTTTTPPSTNFPQRSRSDSASRNDNRFNKRLSQLIRRMPIFVIIYIIQWLPFVVYGFFLTLKPPSFSLTIVVVILTNCGGIANAIAYQVLIVKRTHQLSFQQ